MDSEAVMSGDKRGRSADVPPPSFKFPFEPYDIQTKFMSDLYHVIENGKLGIFESPTGTGKSLSLICGSLTWLERNEERLRQELEELQNPSTVDLKSSSVAGGEPDWLANYDKNQATKDRINKLMIDQGLKQEVKAKIKSLKKPKITTIRKTSHKKKDEIDEQPAESDDKSVNDDDLVVDDYYSDDADPGGRGRGGALGLDNDDENGDIKEHQIMKIFYCSRTHSQLAQFVRELKKSPFGDLVHVVTLGSRQNLCVNDSVKRLKSVGMINDRCLELQKNSKKESVSLDGGRKKMRTSRKSTCQFYRTTAMHDMKYHLLSDITDIEDIVNLALEEKACPYYASRFAVPLAELVCLPYNIILHKATREACGITLSGNIVIIDEAHNLIETINNIHSVEITGLQMSRSYSQLSQYLARYRSRLKAKNLMYIKQLIFILSAFIKYLGGKVGQNPDTRMSGVDADVKIHNINDFLFKTSIDNINMFKTIRYCSESEISKKLSGFVERYSDDLRREDAQCSEDAGGTVSALSSFLSKMSQRHTIQTSTAAVKTTIITARNDDNTTALSSPLRIVEGFLSALTNTDHDGRVLVSKNCTLSESSLKFLHLNPSIHFTDLVSEARSVIVAGGTMQPISDFQDQLFLSTGSSFDRLHHFSCGVFTWLSMGGGHVIPPDHLLPVALSSGPSGQELDFTYQSRDKPHTLDELGRLLVNMCNIIPGGVVAFFPSYECEDRVHSHWEKSGVIATLNRKKQVFREPRKSNQVDMVLAKYSAAIKNCEHNKTGAILFSIVGGKMSEGINFSDELGRCVMMIGLPYPNIKSPELTEKMAYLNMTMKKEGDKNPGQVYYENLCWKAVNQSIGNGTFFSKQRGPLIYRQD